MARKRKAQTITIKQLLRFFSTEERCIEWLEQAQWNGTPTCPHCGGQDSISPAPSKRFTYWHKDCRKQFTVKTGSVMHSSKTPTVNWIITMYAVLTARKGVSAMQLSKELGVQYRTAWYLLQRVREACKRGQLRLANVVEVDETFIGGKEKNKRLSKRSRTEREVYEQKQVVIGMRERGGKTLALPVEGTDRLTLWNAIQKHVEPGSTLYTDDHASYKGIERKRFTHKSVNHSDEEYVRGLIHTNGIESVWSIFKRSIHGTWHHVSFKHLPRYIDEAAFRLNEGNCEVDTLDRMKAVVTAMPGKRIPYRDLVS